MLSQILQLQSYFRIVYGPTYVEGRLGAGVCDGAAAEIRVVSVTSLLAWTVTISANVNKLAASVEYDLVAPNPSHK